MLNKIAAIIGLTNRDEVTLQVLNRIAEKLPEGMTEDSPKFEKAVLKAEQLVNAEGDMAIVNVMKALTAEAPQKVYKIKPSQKGARIKVAAANGIRYSFGPIWNDSILKGRGVAFNEQNREKLNHQGLMFGIKNPEKLKIETLASKIAQKLQAAGA